jgi:branched-subunit amino acid transport protein
MNAWLVILAAGAGSYLMRLSMIVLAGRMRLPQRLEDASALVAPAAFAALAATALAGAAVSAQALPALAAAAVAAIAALRTGFSGAAVLAGMPTFWVLSALLAA